MTEMHSSPGTAPIQTQDPVVVIPAYKPDEKLIELAADLTNGGFRLVVVDDGSGPEYAKTFSAVQGLAGVVVHRHAVNLGKGAALRSGMNAALVEFPQAIGVVTADADGQHLPGDIKKVADELMAYPGAMVLGVREFSGAVPLRSKVGNSVSCGLVAVVMGSRLRDTQTGLRGIPAFFIKDLLRVRSSGYEFELDMLISAKHGSIPVRQFPIATVYLDHNRSSHFRPLVDSLKVGFVLFRFSLLSLVTSLLDNLIFVLAFFAAGNIAASQVCARAFAVLFNYSVVRRAVFLNNDSVRYTLPKYLLLVAVNGFASYQLLHSFSQLFGWNVFASKVAAESLLFLVNFVIQRDLIFTRRRSVAPVWRGADAVEEVVC